MPIVSMIEPSISSPYISPLVSSVKARVVLRSERRNGQLPVLGHLHCSCRGFTHSLRKIGNRFWCWRRCCLGLECETKLSRFLWLRRRACLPCRWEHLLCIPIL